MEYVRFYISTGCLVLNVLFLIHPLVQCTDEGNFTFVSLFTSGSLCVEKIKQCKCVIPLELN